MKEELRILMIEDVPTDAELEVRELKRAGLRVAHRRVDTEEAFREALREFQPEIILSDFSMPHFDGMSALALARELIPDVPFIFVSGTIGEEYAIRALKNGATDYVLKNNLVRLPAAVERALQDARERLALQRAQEALRATEERFRSFMQHLPGRASIRDVEGRYTFVNEFWLRAFGMEASAVLGRAFGEIWPSERADDLKSAHLKVLETNKPASRVFRSGTDGDFRWWLSTHFPIPDAQGNAALVGTVAIDITDRKIQEEKIARLSRIHAVLSGINSTIVRVRDRNELFREACRIAVEHGNFSLAWIGLLDPATLDVTPVASAGLGSDELRQSKATARADMPQGQGVLGRAIRERRLAIDNDISVEASVGGTRRQEALRLGYRSLIVLPLFVEDAVAGVLALFAKEPNFFNDEELKLLTELSGDISFALDYIGKEEQLNYLAYYDQLTGLPNRALFNDRLEQRVSAAYRDRKTFSVVVLDLERFSNVNETFGRPVGDNLLREVAGRLKSALGETNVLAQIGGDIFAVATLPVDEGGYVAHVLEQLLTGVFGRPFELGGKVLRLAARAGVAIYPADGADADRLVRNAEAAHRDAKKTGHRYQFYAPQMNARVAEQMKLENDLRNALLQEQFVLHYQPKFELAGGKMVGMEALIRWKHPERGMVSPVDFVPLLEETGMILDVGRWALTHAAREHAAWSAAGLKPPRIAVNVSQVQLRRMDFVDYVKDALAAVDKAGERIDIEITESMLMEDIEGSVAKLKAVQAVGLQVALDDFGTGYSSLSYLARLPINSLKIDRSFITQMPKSPEQMAIVSTVISLARALNLKVVAEGVETEEQATLLRLLRCDEAQGYLFAKPMPPKEIEGLLPKA